MGIGNKIRLGFLVVGFVLFLSSLVSIIEMGRIRSSVGEVITTNVDNINVSMQLVEVTDQHVFGLLNQIGIPQDSVLEVQSIYDDARFTNYLETSRISFKGKEEKALADTVLFAYAAYMQVINEAPDVWSKNGYNQRRDWYDNRLSPIYGRLRGYLLKLVSYEQATLHANTVSIQSGFYRSMMPGVIAVASGILLLFLLAYFIRLYLTEPIVSIKNGIKSAVLYKKTYNVKMDSVDELSELNDYVAKICNGDSNKL